jgi:hypothetical protein
VGGVDEQRAVAVEQRLVGEVSGDHGFADAIGPDEDDVGGLIDEAELHHVGHGHTVAAGWPVPVEVGQRLEAAKVGGTLTALQSAPVALRHRDAARRGQRLVDGLLHLGGVVGIADPDRVQ